MAVRNRNIDYTKCFLIIAVVVGHIASVMPMSLDENVLFKCVYSWHMYLFMGLGGGTLGLYGKTFDFKWLVGRAKRLLLPYFVWTVIVLLMNGDGFNIGTLFYALFLEPVRWFLATQFLYEFFIFVSRKLGKHNYAFLFVISALSLGLYFAGVKIEMLRHFALFAFFYNLGFYFAREDIIAKIKNKKLIYLIAALYPFAMIFYTYKDHSHWLSLIEQIISNGFIIKVMDKIGFRLFNHCIVSPLGCIFYTGLVISMCRFLESRKNKVCDKFLDGVAFLGKHTMEIYLLHILIINFLVAHMELGIVSYLCMFVLSIVIPVLVTFVMKKLPLLNSILFGYKYSGKLAIGKKNN